MRSRPPNTKRKQADNDITTTRSKLTVNRAEVGKTFGNLLIADECFTVLVGTESAENTSEAPQEFTLRCASFIPRSGFFRKALRNKSLAIVLADDSPSTFEEYARYVYFGTVLDRPEYEDSLDYKDIVQEHYGQMFRFFLLAEKLGDLKTSNMMLDEIYVYSRDGMSLPGRDVINEAYESTDYGSLLRDLLRDMMFYEGNYTHWPIGSMRSVHKKFSEAVMIRIMEHKQYGGPDTSVDDIFGPEVLTQRVARCRYHKHVDGEEDESPKCAQLAPAEGDDMIEQIEGRRANFR
jgi:hypothetical protein